MFFYVFFLFSIFLSLLSVVSHVITFLFVVTLAQEFKRFLINSFQKSSSMLYNQINKNSKCMSKYTTASISPFKNHQKKHLFLKDIHSDIFLVLKNKFFPLHLNIFDQCQFKNQLKLGEKIYFIEQEFDVKLYVIKCDIFQKVLASLYGYQLVYQRYIKLEEILKVVKFFGILTLEYCIYDDIKLNFEQYSPILLFKISKQFQLGWLQKRCLQTFVNLKFQQFFINKFDLMNSDQYIFEQIMKNHEILKSKKIVEGIDSQAIKKIIEQYSEINSTQVDIQCVLSISAEDEQQTEQILNIKQQKYQNKKIENKKRKLTWDCSLEKFNQQYKINKKQETSIQFQQLKEVNIEIKNRINQISLQIKQTKIEMRKNSLQSKQIQELNILFKNMEKNFDQQSKQLGLLQYKTLQFSATKSCQNSPLR